MISTKALIKLAIFLCTSTAWAQNAAFDQAVSMKRDLSHFTTIFEDGLKIDCYSTADRTVTVSKKQPPSLAASFVHQSGEFVALSDYSYTITTSDKARNLVGAQMTIPYKGSDVSDCQAFLGKLSHDGKSWKIFDGKSIHDSNGQTIGTVTQGHLDGEWMLLGRKGSSKFYNFGDDAATAFKLVGGDGRQRATWVDGLSMGVKASSQKTVNVNIGPVGDVSGLPSGYEVFSSYAWKVKSTNPSCTIKAHMKLPLNKKDLKTKLGIEKGQGRGKCAKVAVGCQSANGTVAIAGHERPMPLGMPLFGPWMWNHNGTQGGPWGPPPPGSTDMPYPFPPEGTDYPTGTDTAAAGYPTDVQGGQGGQGAAHGRHGHGRHGFHHGRHHGGRHGGMFGRHHKKGLGVWGLTELDGTYFLMVDPSSVGDCMEMFKNMPHPWWKHGGEDGQDGGEDGPEGPEGPGGEDGGDGEDGSEDGGEGGADGEDGGDEPEPTDYPSETDAPEPTGTGYPAQTQAPPATSAQGYPATSQAPPATTAGYPSKRARGINRHVARRLQH